MDTRFEEAVAEARRIIADGLTTTGMDAARDRFLRQGASRRLRTDPDALIAGSTTDPAIFDHLRFAMTKALFPLFLENEWDIRPGSPFNLLIRIHERHTEPPRQLSAHGGLAGAHRPDQKDVAALHHSPKPIRYHIAS